MKRRRPALKSLACCLTIPALALILFYAILFGQRTLYFGDISLYFVPMLAFQKSELLQGRIPLWNPRILCGTPFIGNPQAWPLYPTTLLLYWLRPERAVAVDGVLHLVWAAFGTFLFLRQRRLDRPASLFGAITWGFGGALVSKLQFPNMIQGASYLPWLLWGMDCLIETPKVARASLLALLCGLDLLAAHPQMFLMQFYVVVVWAVWRLLTKPWTVRRRIVMFTVSAFVLGSCLAAGQLLPVVQTVRTSVRSELTLAKANRFILPPYAAIYNFVAPDFYGNPATPTDYVARGNFWEPCAYGGKLAFLIAVGAAILGFRRNKEERFWAVTALAAVWLALGRESGLYAAAFYVLPGVSKFHDAARWLQPATFALAVLAAQGLNDALAGIKSRTARFLIGAIIVAANTVDLALFVVTLNPTAAPNLFSSVEKAPDKRMRAYYADERLLWGRFVSYRTYDSTVSGKNDEFVQAIGPNLTTMAGFDLVNGYEPVHGLGIEAVLSKLSSVKYPLNAQQLREAGADVLIRLNPGTNEPEVRAVPGSLGRAWVGNQALRVQDRTADSLEIELPSKTDRAALIIADTYAPGWIAEVDGDSATIAPVNGAFRSVALSGHAARVSLKYVPCAWRLGAFVTILASGILSFIWCGLAARRGLRQPSDAA